MSSLRLPTLAQVLANIEYDINDKAKLFWLRKSDGQPVSTPGWNWRWTAREKVKEIEWFDSSKPYYSRYMLLNVFLKRHELIGELQ